MTRTGADLFTAALEQYGVSHLFGNPGTTELPVMNALDDSDVEYVLGLHEDVAVGMAAGYAKTRTHHAHPPPRPPSRPLSGRSVGFRAGCGDRRLASVGKPKRPEREGPGVSGRDPSPASF